MLVWFLPARPILLPLLPHHCTLAGLPLDNPVSIAINVFFVVVCFLLQSKRFVCCTCACIDVKICAQIVQSSAHIEHPNKENPTLIHVLVFKLLNCSSAYSRIGCFNKCQSAHSSAKSRSITNRLSLFRMAPGDATRTNTLKPCINCHLDAEHRCVCVHSF